MSHENANIPVVILSGGQGIFIDNSGKRISKGNVLVGGKPLISYVIMSYLIYGFRKFIISGSYQLEESQNLISSTFENEFYYKNEEFSIEYVDSGADAKTGNRILAVEDKLKESTIFGVTYSDSVSLHDIGEQLKDHIANGLQCTFLGVRLPTRFRVLGIRPGEKKIRGFSDRPFFRGDYINGGFYFFKSDVLKNPIWKSRPNIALEDIVLDNLAASESLQCFFHEGEWHYLDCERDLMKLHQYCEMIKNNWEQSR